MEMYDKVFNQSTFYDMLFFNVKAVLEYPSLNLLKENNPKLYENWKFISRTKYNTNFDKEGVDTQKTYENTAVFHPEFSKIVAITYAKVRSENGELKRDIKKIANHDEYLVIANFIDILDQQSNNGSKLNTILCGYNILNYDIPFLLKRFFRMRDRFPNGFKIPALMKKYLTSKPWESNSIDIMNIWKFNGFTDAPLSLVSDFLGLKRNVDLMTYSELSKHYWKHFSFDPKMALDDINLQSANQTNLTIQFIKEIRNF